MVQQPGLLPGWNNFIFIVSYTIYSTWEQILLPRLEPFNQILGWAIVTCETPHNEIAFPCAIL